MNKSIETYKNIFAEIDRIERDISGLFHNTPLFPKLIRCIESCRNDLTKIIGNTEDKISVGLVGDKNYGKTTILKLLIKIESLKNELAEGIGQLGATRKISYFGNKPPRELDPECEYFRYLDIKNDTILDHDVLLIDNPGNTDIETTECKKITRLAGDIKLWTIKESDYSIDNILDNGIGLNGTQVIIIVNFCRHQELHGKIRKELLEKLGREAPHAILNDIIFLPDWKLLSEQEENFWKEKKAPQLLKSAISNAVIQHSNLTINTDIRVNDRIDRLRQDISTLLPSEYTTKLSSITQELESSKITSVAKVLTPYFSCDNRSEDAIAHGIRSQIFTELPSFCFPAKPVTKLLTVTAGAWQSAALGFMSGIPSFGAVALSSFKNTIDKKSLKSDMQDAIHERLRSEMVDETRRPLRDLHILIGANNKDVKHSFLDPKITGVDALQRGSTEIYRATVKEYTSRSIVFSFSLFASLIFLALMAAPIFSLYQTYSSVAIDIFSLSPTTFDALPVISPSVFTSAFMLSILPTFIVCGVLIAHLTRRSTLKAAARKVQDEHQILFANLVQSGELNVATTHTQIQHALSLGRFVTLDHSGKESTMN